MISDKILNIFKSREDAISKQKSYVILIDDMKNNLNDACDQESILIETTELRIPQDRMCKLLQAYSSKKRILEIVSSINVDRDGLYYGKLNAFIDSGNSHSYDLQEEEPSPEILSREISILKTTLQNEIHIDFNSSFIDQPIVHITIDKKYENLYRDYSTDFIRDGNKDYLGVNITFKSLKLRESYPPIGIIIIGDIKEDFYEEDDENFDYKTMTFFVAEDSLENINEEEETEEDICTKKIDDVINQMIFDANIEFVEQGENLKTNRCGKVINLIEKSNEPYHIIVTKEGYETQTVEYNTSDNNIITIKLQKTNTESQNENSEEPVNPEEPGGNTNDSD